jgi:hypothetical protein
MHVYLNECQLSEAVMLECGVYYFKSLTAKDGLLKLVCLNQLKKCPTVLAIMPEVLLLLIERMTIAFAMHFYENLAQKLHFLNGQNFKVT